jgi:hypothetical protein
MFEVEKTRHETRQVQSIVCEKCKRPTAILVLGITMAASSVTITISSLYMKHLYEQDKTNLDKY